MRSARLASCVAMTRYWGLMRSLSARCASDSASARDEEHSRWRRWITASCRMPFLVRRRGAPSSVSSCSAGWMKPSRYSRLKKSVVRWYRSASARVSFTSGCRGRRGGRFKSSTTLERRVRIITSCVRARSAAGSRGWRWSPETRCSLLRSEEHTSELQSRGHLVCRLLLLPPQSYPLSLHDALPISLVQVRLGARQLHLRLPRPARRQVQVVDHARAPGADHHLVRQGA